MSNLSLHFATTDYMVIKKGNNYKVPYVTKSTISFTREQSLIFTLQQ